MGSYYDVDLVNGYEPLNLRHYAEYLWVMEGGDPSRPPRSPRLWTDLTRVAKPELLRALDARYIIGNRPVPADRIGYELVGRKDDVPVYDFYRGMVRVPVYLWRDRYPLGPAYFARSLASVSDEAGSLAAVAASTSALDAHVFGWRGEALDFSGGAVRMTRRGENVYEYEVDSRGRNFLILSQVWYPGWRASLDGRESEIDRVNHALIGLIVPPGRHVLSLEMTSPMLRAGLILCALGAAGVVALFVVM
jgi:hypothetical protein